MTKKNYEFWDKTFKKFDWGQYSSEDLIRFISINNNKFRKKKILEIGCGTGSNFNLFLDKDADITGVDFSKIAIKKAKKRFKKEISLGRINLIHNDIRNLELKNKKFNFLVDNCTTCCLSYDETKSFYDSINKFLTKNALIYIRTFATNSWGYKLGKKISYNRFMPTQWLRGLGPQRYSSINDIQKILNRNFKNIYIEMISRTVNNRKHSIKEWIVNARSK